MKALVFSDIHGSLGTADFIAKKYAEVAPDFLFLLGDLLYHGPRNILASDYNPKGVIEVLNSLSNTIVAVRGNCDSEVDAMVLSFPIEATYSWCIEKKVRYFLTHGHIFHPENHPSLKTGDVLLYGHTHIPQAEQSKGMYYCNPGSMTLPKQGHPPTYGLLEDNHFFVFTATESLYLSQNLS